MADLRTEDYRNISVQRAFRWPLLSIILTLLTVALIVLIVNKRRSSSTVIGDLMDKNGNPLFVAESATMGEGALTLVRALQVDPQSDQRIAKGNLGQFEGKYLIFCNDQVTAESLKVLQAGSITIGDPALRTDLLASGMAAMPHPVDLPVGTVTVVKVGPRGEVQQTKTDRFTQITFEYQNVRE